MNVKRYEWVACDEHACHCDVVESAEGDMVDYEDYAALEARCAALAAENAGLKDFVKTCFRAAADGASLDGADIQELGERLGLFGRETYQPALHGYICGHEAGEDTVCVMKKTPATDAFLAEVRANVIKEALKSLDGVFDTDCVMESNGISYEDAEQRTAGAYAVSKALEEFAAQLRKGVQP
ncbi:ead/Ea22-like family protein [Enterobacter roggenkampii]|uniref:ead/Ea22-like family protein n=1 Tax=Enterobacter roggenkampii TaxID=1812935 RepID=UPI0024085596|nr:ead/Ea22-like family protein [Enterobacter roggenkampii]WEY54599.1 ead/Ea22-like family protein [Enterobacter roggenkampii]